MTIFILQPMKQIQKVKSLKLKYIHIHNIVLRFLLFQLTRHFLLPLPLASSFFFFFLVNTNIRFPPSPSYSFDTKCLFLLLLVPLSLSLSLYIYIYIDIHTHTQIYIYIHTVDAFESDTFLWLLPLVSCRLMENFSFLNVTRCLECYLIYIL